MGLPNGTEHSGTLTMVTAPVIGNAPAGTPVQLWLAAINVPASLIDVTQKIGNASEGRVYVAAYVDGWVRPNVG